MITLCLVDTSLTNTFDKVRDRFWWPTLHRDVKTWCQDCQACQRRKTPHRGPKLPTGHLPVDRPFQRVSIDLVENKTESVSPTGLECSHALTIVDHLTRFAVLVALPDKKEQTIAKALVERVFGIFGPPETLHSDQGPEFENKVVKQLQDVFGYKKTKTTPYRPQGNSVSERMHSTLHAMLSMYSNIAQNNWTEVLPFIQLAHNTSFSSTMHETPFFLITIIDHLTRFPVLVALPDKKEQTIAKALVERVFGIFGPPETLHSDQGPEFENKVVKQLQDVFGYKKTKTTPYRPQGNSVSERMHSTLHAMLSMYSNIAQNNWTEVLPFIQLAHNTSFSSTMHETPFFLMFGRQERLPIDIIFGIPHVGRSTNTEELAHSTRENLQIASELARRNLSKRIDKQKADNSKLPPIPEFTPGQKVLVYKPHHSTDGPNPKLIQPWRGPYIICSKLSPVVYRIRHPDDTKQVSVHLAHIKSYRPRQSAPAPDFHKLEGLFLGKTLPTPALEESETVLPHIGIYQVADVVGHRRGQGRHSPHNYIYRLRLKGFGPEADLEYRAHQIPQCQELIAAHRAQHQLETITLLLAISGSILLRKTAIPPVVVPHRKTVVPSKANPLFANVLAISGSIVLRKTAIPSVATPHRKTVVPSKADPLFASPLAISRSIVIRKTVIPSEAISHRKTVVRSNANPLLASANPDLARIKRKIIQRGESE